MRPFILKCLLLFFAVQSAQAQQFPVTASTQVIPPYSVYLPDYAVPGSDKLRVILVQNDLTQPSYDVILQMTVEQNGTLIMRTSGAFHPRPLTLTAGVPTIISGTDLSEYLNTNNIDFSGGFSRENYDRTKALPEGAYRITFTAFDYRRPTVQVSNDGSNIFFFQKSDPPLLNLPICGSRVEKHDPQFLSFNWSNRNTPNSSTEYIFSLYEIKPKNTNADYIVKSSQPLYTITTENNTLIYGPGEPQLIDSMEYVWIVQASDKNGRDLFSNQGYSQSCKFTYLGTNPFQVLNINKPLLYGQSNGERSVKFWWPLSHTNQYKVESYRLQYRASAKDGVEYDWYTEEYTTDSTLTLHSLEPNRSYEARLQWRVAGVYSPYSELMKVSTDSLRVFSCGDGNQLQLPVNSQPLPSAIAGNIVRVGLFDVMLTSVTGGNGVFSGTGKVITPGFGMGLPMLFKDISINTDLVVTRGEMQAVTSGIDKLVSDELKNQRGGDDVGQIKTGDIVPSVITKLHLFTKDNISVDTSSGTIILNEGKEVINYAKDGKALPLVIEDADGHLFNVDKNGTVADAGIRDKNINTATLNNLDLRNGRIIFSAGPDNKYAFDAWKDAYAGKPVLENSYELIADYRVSAKAIVPGVQENIIATLENGNIDNIKFVSGKGIVYPSTNNGNHYTVTITGGPAGDAQEVFAVDARNVSIGKLLVASYAPKLQKIIIIPVGVNTVVPEAAIKTSLDKAYGKIGITYNVETDNTFRTDISWDKNADQVLQDGSSTFLGNSFTGEEKAMKKAFDKTHGIGDDVTYLFLVNEATLSNGDLLGKMPRQSQFGFIFVKGATAEAVGRTVAHEVGHGAYTLEHTFSDGIGLSTTDNLMDYKDGYDLLKYQWDVVHDPGHVWGIFEDDDASADYGVNKISADFLNEDGKTVSFVTPAGTILSLPLKGLSNVRFQYGAIYGEDQYTANLISGAIRGFQFETNTYEYNKTKNEYVNTITGASYVPTTDISNVCIYPLPSGEEYNLYKFTITGFAPFKNGSTSTLSGFPEFALKFSPFGNSPAIKNIKQSIKNLAESGCTYCINAATVGMTAAHRETPELIWVDKIAQMRAVYSEYFPLFTQLGKIKATRFIGGGEYDGNWEVPQSFHFEITEAEVPAKTTQERTAESWIWGKYLADHSDVKDADKVTFFHTFYDEFGKYITGTVLNSDDFWKTFSTSTDLQILLAQMKQESDFHLRTVPYEKREIAFAKIVKATSFWVSREEECIKLLASFDKEEYTDVLKYIETNIGYKTIYTNFYNQKNPLFSGNNCLTSVLSLISQMISVSGYTIVDDAIEAKFTDDGSNMPQLEADMFQFKNFSWDFVNENTLKIDGYEHAAYNQLVSVHIAGTFKFNGDTYSNGGIFQMPAIQAVLMNHINRLEVAEKSAVLAANVGMLAMSVAGAPILFTAGNLIQKTAMVADLAGFTTQVVLQSLNTDAISDKLRDRIQMAGFILSAPNLSMLIPKVKSVVTDLDVIINTRLTSNGVRVTEEQLAELTQIRNGLSAEAHLVEDFADDIAEVGNRAVVIGGGDLNKVERWLKDNGDNFYIIVHSNGSDFSIVHNGVEEAITHRSVAKWIAGADIPVKKQIVLLSCSDIETAQNLSNKIGRSVVANDGAVTVYNNGFVEAEGGFMTLSPDGEPVAAELKFAESAVGEDMVVLGRVAKRTPGVQLITTYKGKIVGKYSYGEYLEIINPERPLYGGNKFILGPDITTTVLGSVEDMEVIKDRGKLLRGILKMEENKGALNVLSSPEWDIIRFSKENLSIKAEQGVNAYFMAIKKEFWQKFNKPWLEEAIARRDPIRFISDPKSELSLYSTDPFGEFVFEGKDRLPTIFSWEIDLLKSKGYTILPDGTAIIK
jgi:hypothetical protein